jgi:hypothetical protein
VNALANFPGQLNGHLPTSKILHFASTHSFMLPRWLRKNPIPDALTLFTDASGTGMSAYYSAKGHKVEQMSFFTAQGTELQAVIIACCDFSTEAINVYTDSAYVSGVQRAIKTAHIGIPIMRNYSICFANCGVSYRLTTIPTLWDTYAPTPVFRVLLLRATKIQMFWLLLLTFWDMLTPVLLVLLSHSCSKSCALSSKLKCPL